MNDQRRWTQSDITDLRGLALLGATLEKLAGDLARTPVDVVRMAARLRIHISSVKLSGL
jgi:hypothetical protein